MRRSFVAMVLASLVGCGSSTSAPGVATEPAEPAVCNGHRATDGCMNEENFARCLERERECPGRVIDLESCPLQFSCR